MKKSVRESLDLISEKYGITKQDALMLGSATIYFGTSQVVDIVKGIHGVISEERFQNLEK